MVLEKAGRTFIGHHLVLMLVLAALEGDGALQRLPSQPDLDRRDGRAPAPSKGAESRRRSSAGVASPELVEHGERGGGSTRAGARAGGAESPAAAESAEEN